MKFFSNKNIKQCLVNLFNNAERLDTAPANFAEKFLDLRREFNDTEAHLQSSQALFAYAFSGSSPSLLFQKYLLEIVRQKTIGFDEFVEVFDIRQLIKDDIDVDSPDSDAVRMKKRMKNIFNFVVMISDCIDALIQIPEQERIFKFAKTFETFLNSLIELYEYSVKKLPRPDPINQGTSYEVLKSIQNILMWITKQETFEFLKALLFLNSQLDDEKSNRTGFISKNIMIRFSAFNSAHMKEPIEQFHEIAKLFDFSFDSNARIYVDPFVKDGVVPNSEIFIDSWIRKEAFALTVEATIERLILFSRYYLASPWTIMKSFCKFIFDELIQITLSDDGQKVKNFFFVYFRSVKIIQGYTAKLTEDEDSTIIADFITEYLLNTFQENVDRLKMSRHLFLQNFVQQLVNANVVKSSDVFNNFFGDASIHLTTVDVLFQDIVTFEEQLDDLIQKDEDELFTRLSSSVKLYNFCLTALYTDKLPKLISTIFKLNNDQKHFGLHTTFCIILYLLGGDDIYAKYHHHMPYILVEFITSCFPSKFSSNKKLFEISRQNIFETRGFTVSVSEYENILKKPDTVYPDILLFVIDQIIEDAVSTIKDGEPLSEHFFEDIQNLEVNFQMTAVMCLLKRCLSIGEKHLPKMLDFIIEFRTIIQPSPIINDMNKFIDNFLLSQQLSSMKREMNCENFQLMRLLAKSAVNFGHQPEEFAQFNDLYVKLGAHIYTTTVLNTLFFRPEMDQINSVRNAFLLLQFDVAQCTIEAMNYLTEHLFFKCHHLEGSHNGELNCLIRLVLMLVNTSWKSPQLHAMPRIKFFEESPILPSFNPREKSPPKVGVEEDNIVMKAFKDLLKKFIAINGSLEPIFRQKIQTALCEEANFCFDEESRKQFNELFYKAYMLSVDKCASSISFLDIVKFFPLFNKENGRRTVKLMLHLLNKKREQA